MQAQRPRSAAPGMPGAMSSVSCSVRCSFVKLRNCDEADDGLLVHVASSKQTRPIILRKSDWTAIGTFCAELVDQQSVISAQSLTLGLLRRFWVAAADLSSWDCPPLGNRIVSKHPAHVVEG